MKNKNYLILQEAIAASKSILSLMGAKKNLDVPALEVGKLIGALQKMESDEQVKDLIKKLQSVNAYIIGASQDLTNLSADLRKFPDIKTKMDAQLATESIQKFIKEAEKQILLRDLISEIIRKCGDKWCLYTKGKDKKTGQRRRLGTHPSRSAAERQERAIKASGG